MSTLVLGPYVGYRILQATPKHLVCAAITRILVTHETIFKPTMTETLRLENFLPYRLFVLANRFSSSLAKQYEDNFQITRPEWRVIAVLGEESDLSAATVADRTAMDKVAVSRAVTKLLNQKLLQRRFAKDDKRRSVLQLSKSGRALYEEIVPIALEHENKIVEQLNDKEIELLRKTIDKLDAIELDF